MGEYTILTPNTFLFRGEEFKVGEKVMVSDHYAGYKSQYNWMFGEVFINENNVPSVRIEVNPNDIEQGKEQQLAVWGVVEKV